MNPQSNNLITQLVAIKAFPETKSQVYNDGQDTYKYDVLKGIRIPTSATSNKNNIKKVEFKFSPNSNTPGVSKSALEVTKMIAERFDRLQKGELYAKVSLYMSPRTNKAGVVDTYTPYINDIEFVDADAHIKPCVEAALNADVIASF
jgi:hypothetical protein